MAEHRSASGSSSEEFTGRRVLFRNSALNMGTQGLLIILAFVCLPFLTSKLSRTDFGLLTLVWALIGHFSLLDFGISRASTKFVAEMLARQDKPGLGRTVWLSLVLSFAIGVAACAILVLAVPFLVTDIFKLGAADQGAAARAFTIAAIGVPLTLLTGTIRGVQMAYQRFTIVNVTQGLNGLIQWSGAALAAWLGWGLEGVVVVTVSSRAVALLVSAIDLASHMPGLVRSFVLWDRATARSLLGFGGWVAISQGVSPLFQYLDRIMIGAFLSMTAVGYYAVPQEALVRLLVIPLSLTLTLFPALSYRTAVNSRGGGELYLRSLRLSLIGLIPLSLLLTVFARDILMAWLGKEFADACTPVFQIISIGLFFNMVSQVPATLLQALGRPDLLAKLNLAELPAAVLLNVALIPSLGIVGAALTWSARVIADALFLFWFAQRTVRRRGSNADFRWVWRSLTAQGIVVSVAAVLAKWTPSFPLRAGVVGPAVGLFLVLMWVYGLDPQDKVMLLRFWRPSSTLGQ